VQKVVEGVNVARKESIIFCDGTYITKIIFHFVKISDLKKEWENKYSISLVLLFETIQRTFNNPSSTKNRMSTTISFVGIPDTDDTVERLNWFPMMVEAMRSFCWEALSSRNKEVREF
jgi:hypothetical protein